MIDKILEAVLGEAKAFLGQDNFGGQVMLRVDFKSQKIPDYNMPLVLLALEDASESRQYPGGLTEMNWKFSFNSYNFEPNAYVDEDYGYSTSLLRHPIDTVRQHFSLGARGRIGWLNPQMYEVFQEYGFQFTLEGITVADTLDQIGLILGYKIGFDTTALDRTTLYTEYCERLETITQINNPPFAPNEPPIS